MISTAGTGFSLSVSYFIVAEGHSGDIQVMSILEKATCFVIRLPLRGRGSVLTYG